MSMRHKSSHLLGLLIALSLGVGLGTAVRGQQPVTLETVMRAWKDRQERVQSARIEWIDRETVPRGALSDSWKTAGFTAQELEAKGIRPGAIVPPRDTTYDEACSVSLDGEKIRLEREERRWSGREDAFVLSPFISVYDGNVGSTLLPRGGVDQKPQASLGRGYTNYMDGPYMRAVALVYRPFVPRVSPVDLTAFTISGRQPIANGKACLELERTFSRGVVQRVWVDPSLQFAPVRCMFQSQNRITSKLDLVYRRTPGGENALTGWELNTFDPTGKLKRANRVQEVKAEINAAVPGSVFRLELPPETVVVDQTTPGNPLTYRLNERGTKGEVQDAFGTLAKKETSLVPWLGIVAGVVALLAGCWFIWRRIASRHVSGSNVTA